MTPRATVSQAIQDTLDLLKISQSQQDTLASEDRSTLPMSRYEEFVKETNAAEAQVSKSIEHYRTQLRKTHNLQISFHRLLPIELVVQIVHLSTGRRSKGVEDAVLERMTELSSVCSLWNDIVQSTPQMWSSIHSDDSQNLVDKALRISKSSPLDVTVITKGHDDSEWLLFRLVPHIPRCRSFALHLRTVASLRLILTHPAPLLESFDVMLALSGPQIGPSEFFAGTSPRLRDLEIQSVDLNLEHINTLKELKISDTGPQKPSLRSLIDILCRNPQLEHLTLHTMETEMGADEISHLPPIHLPHLRQLSLSQIPEHSAHHLLSIIQIPSCESFLFGGASSTSQHSSSLDSVALDHVLQVIAPVAALKGLVLVQICESYPFACGAARQPSKLRSTSLGLSQKPPYDLFVRLRHANVEASLKSFVNSVVPTLQDFKVIVELQDDLASITGWAHYLDLIPRLTELRVPIQALNWLKEYLRTPGAARHPELKKIVIAEWDPRRLPALVVLVDSRYGATRGTLEDLKEPKVILEVRSYNVDGELKILDVMQKEGRTFYSVYLL